MANEHNMDFILYLIVLFGIITYELIRKKRDRFDLLSLINLHFILGYLLVPLWFIYSTAPNEIKYSHLIITPVYVAVAYLFFIIGWLALEKKYVFSPKKVVFDERMVRLLSIAATGMSLLMLYMYSQAFGGFWDALKFGSLYRYSSAAAKESVEIGGSASALYFNGFAKIVFVYCLYRIKDDFNKNKYFFGLLLVASFTILFAFSIIVASRGLIVGIFVLSYLIIVRMNKRFPIIISMLLCVFVVIMIGYGKPLISLASYYAQSGQIDFERIDKQDTKYVTDRILIEISHPVISLEKAIETVGTKIDYTYMAHFPNAILHLIPSKLLGIQFEKPKTISHINSMNVVGEDSGIPPGLIGSFYYGFSLVGVAIGMLLFGGISKLLQNSLYKWLETYTGVLPFMVLIFYDYSQFILSGDLKVELQANFYLIIVLIALIVTGRAKHFRLRRLKHPIVAPLQHNL